jgi:PII-like signaling protein
MELPRDAVLLRIFVEEGNEHDGEPLFRKIVLKAREMGLAGATVLRGPLGFGRASELHASGLFHPLTGASIVIEIVDSEEKIQALLTAAENMVGSRLITLEKVQAIFYKGESSNRRRK